MRARTTDDKRFTRFAEAISTKLEFHGAWFFQVKEDVDGELVLLEVAPRVAGTSGLTRVKGVNMSLLSIYEHLRSPIRLLVNEGPVEVDRALESRYVQPIDYDRVYLDLDDTLVQAGRVHLQTVGFVFQCINRKIPVSLITRHNQDLRATLAAFRLNGLFDEVIHIRDGAAKAAFIRSDRAIFIDDSFRERLAVAAKGIATFDTSMLDGLIDSRL